MCCLEDVQKIILGAIEMHLDSKFGSENVYVEFMLPVGSSN